MQNAGKMTMKREKYKRSLKDLQIKLVTLQRHLIAHKHKVLLIFEGRDAAGKDGTIFRITRHLSPRETRVVALGAPSQSDLSSWYFRRFVAHLPSEKEVVLFNRSWYNRAGVERVMGYCSQDDYESFVQMVLPFEHMLKQSQIRVLKYYLDISRDEQRKRLQDRRVNPLKTWKISPIDAVALDHWDDYTAARDEMLKRTHDEISPWYVVRADNKKRARLNVIRHILTHVDCPDRNEHWAPTDPDILTRYDQAVKHPGFLAE